MDMGKKVNLFLFFDSEGMFTFEMDIILRCIFFFSFSFFLYFCLYLSVTACMFYWHSTITSSPRSIRRGSLVLSFAEIRSYAFFSSFYHTIISKFVRLVAS